MKIYKYYLEPGCNAFPMPENATILSTQEQKGHICMWASFDREFPTEMRRFDVAPTGRDVEIYPGTHHNYVGTVQLDWTVWHIFELK